MKIKTTKVICNSFFIFPLKMKNEKHALYFICKMKNEWKTLKSRANINRTLKSRQFIEFPFPLIVLKMKVSILFWIPFFNLSWKWNGTLDTQIYHSPKIVHHHYHQLIIIIIMINISWLSSSSTLWRHFFETKLFYKFVLSVKNVFH